LGQASNDYTQHNVIAENLQHVQVGACKMDGGVFSEGCVAVLICPHNPRARPLQKSCDMLCVRFLHLFPKYLLPYVQLYI